MKKTNLFLVSCMMYFACSMTTYANNVQIGTPSVATNDISFTIQWDNSWKVSTGPNNWDAVWVFVKYQDCTGLNEWQHVNLSTTSGNHSVTGGVLQVEAVADGKGVYIRRTADGIGNIASATATLRMGFSDASYNYKVFGVEMVYIPTESFYVGDGSSTKRLGVYSSYVPIQITSSDAPTIGYGCTNGLTNPPASYPSGYDSIYCMKYEISQEQYVGFLNTLTYDQQVTRTAASPNSGTGTLALTGASQNRNGIKIEIAGVLGGNPAVYMNDLTTGTYNSTNDGQNIALNWINWDDLIAYMDWAALRPMSELEYEKVCRGPVAATNNEYPWGNNSSILQAKSNALNNPQTSSEISTASGDGLCAYNNSSGGNYGPGPLRVGFAATDTTTRIQAGATYYGVMDMAGNVWEQCVKLIAAATTFTTATGDGTLTVAGNANVANWPTYSNSIPRGGSYSSGSASCKLSERNWPCSNTFQFRSSQAGGRGVRAY